LAVTTAKLADNSVTPDKINFSSVEFMYDNLVPIGTIWPMARMTIPSGWLYCNGDHIASGDYPELYTVLYDSYPSQRTSSGVYIPDLRGRVTRGAASIDLSSSPVTSGADYKH
jgi:microcystin-dependent protein